MNEIRPVTIIAILFAAVPVIGTVAAWGTYPVGSPETQLQAAATDDSPITTEMATPEIGQTVLAPPAVVAGPGSVSRGTTASCEPVPPADSASTVVTPPADAPGCTDLAPPAARTTTTADIVCEDTPPTQSVIVDVEGGGEITVSSGGSSCSGPAQSPNQSPTSNAPALVCEQSPPTQTSWVVADSLRGRIIPVGVGTGSCSAAQPGAPTPTPQVAPSPGEPCTALPGWTTQGEDLRAGKKAAFQHHPGYADLPGSNAGDYAYPSQPIDIHGPSTYTFDFGPLDQDQFFNSPSPGSHAEPSAPNIALFAPPDYQVQLAPTTEPSIVTKDGGRYLRQPIELTGDPRPCTQLVIWLV